jgi:hypothetical protein
MMSVFDRDRQRTDQESRALFLLVEDDKPVAGMSLL